MDEGLTLDDIRAELTDLGRTLLDQAIGSALRARQYRDEIARLSNTARSTE